MPDRLDDIDAWRCLSDLAEAGILRVEDAAGGVMQNYVAARFTYGALGQRLERHQCIRAVSIEHIVVTMGQKVLGADTDKETERAQRDQFAQQVWQWNAKQNWTS